MGIRYSLKKLYLFLQGDQFQVLDEQETINKLIQDRCAFVRFGDGEFNIISGGRIGFQEENEQLKEKLADIFKEQDDEVLIGIPDVVNYSAYSKLTNKSQEFWVNYMFKNNKKWRAFLNQNKVYGCANVTRCYMRNKQKLESAIIFEKFKMLWNERNVLIIEGAKTRLGTNNDLLDSAKSIRRLLCPEKNAYNLYDDILLRVLQIAKHDDVILIALGPTATVLSYELGKKGFQAIDIGHLDVEYEWCNMGVEDKVCLKGKYVNEVIKGDIADEIEDGKYESEIIDILKEKG